LRLGYNVDSAIGLTQYIVLPSILVDYNVNPNLTFETEVGMQWTFGAQPIINTSDRELFVTVGFRYNFGLDGTKLANRSNPATPAAAAICRYTVHPDGSCATPSPVTQ